MENNTVSEKENKLITNEYRSLIRAVSGRLNLKEKKNIRQAFNIAIKAHKNSRRESGKLYVSHPISVAKIIANDIGLGATSIICGLLHDVVEDTIITIDNIKKQS